MKQSSRYTWLGHATFLLVSPGGKRILFDPWVTGNPTSPESAKELGALDLMLITHGHSDHTGDAVAIGAIERRAGRGAVRAVGVAAAEGAARTSSG